MIAIIDYGAGNLKSVKKAFDFLNVKSKVISSGSELEDFEKLVLPGVGAFGATANSLKKAEFYEPVKEWIKQDKPFLGICLGLQMLFESSMEAKGVEGLEIYKGTNLKFTQGKVPQMGWNQIKKQKPSRILEGIEDGSFFYFLHGYYIAPEDNDIILTTTDYFIEYPSMIEKGNICATQFHPEKSGDIGIRLLKNWVELC